MISTGSTLMSNSRYGESVRTVGVKVAVCGGDPAGHVAGGTVRMISCTTSFDQSSDSRTERCPSSTRSENPSHEFARTVARPRSPIRRASSGLSWRYRTFSAMASAFRIETTTPAPSINSVGCFPWRQPGVPMPWPPRTPSRTLRSERDARTPLPAGTAQRYRQWITQNSLCLIFAPYLDNAAF